MLKTKNNPRQKMIPGTRPPPQTCRQLLLVCPRCGYRLRASKYWIAIGIPTCPCGTKFKRK